MISIQGIYSVAQTVRLRAKELSDDIVFHFEDKKMTFAEYHSLSSQTANGLLAEGVLPESGRPEPSVDLLLEGVSDLVPGWEL